MKKTSLAALAIILLVSCGDDKPNNPGPVGITVTVLPARPVVELDSSVQFYATVNGTDDRSVIWLADGVIGGNSVHGLIDSTGRYSAPSLEPMGVDSVRITARSLADTTKIGNAYALLVDPDVIYVKLTGSDTTGIGSSRNPYRTITKALTRARAGQAVMVGPGEYNTAVGERFPLRITSQITLHGAGADSTYITGPGGMDPRSDAIIETDGDVVLVEGVHLRSSNFLGVGIWLKPGLHSRVSRCTIERNYIGVYASGPGVPRPILESTRISDDSIGIMTDEASRLLIRDNTIVNCRKYGVDIRGTSAPDLGTNDSTDVGGNTIDSCGNVAYQWLIYNGTTNIIQAQGNSWPNPVPDYNDIYIYDDEESAGASGPVVLSSH